MLNMFAFDVFSVCYSLGQSVMDITLYVSSFVWFLIYFSVCLFCQLLRSYGQFVLVNVKYRLFYCITSPLNLFSVNHQCFCMCDCQDVCLFICLHFFQQQIAYWQFVLVFKQKYLIQKKVVKYHYGKLVHFFCYFKIL